MPPRPSPPAGKPRRRSTPVMPGGWIWVVILAMVVGIFLFTNMNSGGTIKYSDFVRMVMDPELSRHLKKVTFVGTDHIKGEVDDKNNLPDDIKQHMSNNHFSTLKPQIDDKQISEKLN